MGVATTDPARFEGTCDSGSRWNQLEVTNTDSMTWTDDVVVR